MADWPLCDTSQLAGLMGGVNRRRANQVVRSLAGYGLIRADGDLHVLTDECLTYLAHRDRASVRQVLDRWTAEPSLSNPQVYAGTALRALASQPDHHAALTTLAATLTAEYAKSREYGLLDLLPTSRSAVGYWHDGTSYVVHPDATFWLSHRGDWRPYFLEYERRTVTARRFRDRLKNCPRYLASGWADLDHAGQLPLVLFVFETHDAEASFLRAAGAHRLPICTSNLKMINDLGVLREVWRWPPPNAPDRLPLHRLGEGYKNVPSRSRHFL